MPGRRRTKLEDTTVGRTDEILKNMVKIESWKSALPDEKLRSKNIWSRLTWVDLVATTTGETGLSPKESRTPKATLSCCRPQYCRGNLESVRTGSRQAITNEPCYQRERCVSVYGNKEKKHGQSLIKCFLEAKRRWRESFSFIIDPAPHMD